MLNNIMMVGGYFMAVIVGLTLGTMFSYGIALLTLEFLRLVA